MREILKFIYTTFLILVASIIIGTITLIAVYALPTKMMTDNIKQAIPLFQKEGVYPTWTGDQTKYSSRLDNFSDSVILGNVIYPGSKSVTNDAMLNPRIRYKDCDTVQSLIKQLRGEKGNFTISTYSRYWHGYLIVLKPFSMITTMSNIRLLNLIMQVFLASYLIFLIGNCLGKGYGISYLLMYLVLNPVSLAMSLMFSPLFYIMTIISIVLLRKWNYFIKGERYLYFFSLSGMLTAYFDLLSYPLVSLCIPLIIFLVKMNEEDTLKEKESIKIIIKNSFF